MPPANSISNRLLLALTPEDLDGLRAHLELVPLPTSGLSQIRVRRYNICISPRKGWYRSSNRCTER
jgi:hypothetical protein